MVNTETVKISEELRVVNEILETERNVRRTFVLLTVWDRRPRAIAPLWFHGHIVFRVPITGWQKRKYQCRLIFGYDMEEAFPFGLPF